MADRLTVWCLASFNVATLTAVGVLTIHVVADLGHLLAGLSTVTGLALYLALWAITFWSNERALAGVGESEPGPGARTLVVHALGWGGATGACFLWVIIALVYLPEASSLVVVLREGPEFVVLVLIVSIFAALVGALVGLVVGSLDLLLLRTARAVGASDEV